VKLSHIATETVAIAQRGSYVSASGIAVDVQGAVRRAAAGTVLHGADEGEPLDPPESTGSAADIRVTAEGTAQAARRLVEREGLARVAALNFASAKNPGGGFLGGAKAQEEDLARSSALYHCLVTQRAYYDANRACESLLYTDHLIYSPDVPFFRDEDHRLIEQPFLVSILTSPAPNAGALSRGEGYLLRPTLERRATQILRVAAHHRHRVLVLGAWGCGVFRNDPVMVGDVFAQLLESDPWRTAFTLVVFAVFDRSKSQSNLRAFRERFGPAMTS
jgi:uncharacterized protein (TIGR02452 family)